jgi:hypothetical protein
MTALEKRLWQVLSTIQEGIRYSDGKAVALLGIQGVLIGLAVVFVTDTYASFCTTMIFSLFLFVGIIFITISMIFSFMCLSPRLKNAVEISPIYFSSIAKNFKNWGTYITYFKDNFDSEVKITESIAEQIHTNSIIANKKFQMVSWSIKFLVLGLVFWVIFLVSVIL